MPVNPCSDNNKPGFKWGDSGKCYIYERGNPKSMGEAKRKATIQGIATGEYTKKDIFEGKGEKMNEVTEEASLEEGALTDALISVAQKFGPFDAEDSGIWIDYESAEDNDDKAMGVHCKNCTLYSGEGVCKILSQQVEEYGKCRFALIPDGLIIPEMEEEEEGEDEEENSMSSLISLIRDLLSNKEN